MAAKRDEGGIADDVLDTKFLTVPRGIPYLDPLPALRADWQAKKAYDPRTGLAAASTKLFYDHCHYTPYGYTVVAREILAGLDREKLIPK
jgi:hypothetical protein